MQGADQQNVGSHSKSGICVKTVSQVWLSCGARQCSSQSQGLRVRTATPLQASHGLHFSSLLSFASLLSRIPNCPNSREKVQKNKGPGPKLSRHPLSPQYEAETTHCPPNALGQSLQMVHVVWFRELQPSRQQWFAYSASMNQAGAFLACWMESAGG